VRQLYTDQDEVLFDVTRPVILNGIENVVTRPDLADRSLFAMLDPIPEERRRPVAELWTAFEPARPGILGALLDAVAEGLRRLPGIKLAKLPRMADFALWVTACETALWPAGTFEAAYRHNRDVAVEDVIDADPVAAAVRTLMSKRTMWTGTASDLLGALAMETSERIIKTRTWPTTPGVLSNRLRRAATFLRKIGVTITFDRQGQVRTRTIRITTTQTHTAKESDRVRASAPSASSAADPAHPSSTNGSTRGDGTAGNGGNGADGTDATYPPQSGVKHTAQSME
jgi:hypothetical protein